MTRRRGKRRRGGWTNGLFFAGKGGRGKGGRALERGGEGGEPVANFRGRLELWQKGRRGGEGCTGLRWRRPVYRCDVIRKHAGSTNLSQGMGRGRGSNLVQRNEFSARPPLRFAAPSSSPTFHRDSSLFHSSLLELFSSPLLLLLFKEEVISFLLVEV